MYSFINRLVLLEELRVGSRGAVVEGFRLGCCVCVGQESNYPRNWYLRDIEIGAL
jgi:hypothetical protein